MRAGLTICAAFVVALHAAASDAGAQHDGHVGPATATSAPRNADCARAGRTARAIIDAAGARLAAAPPVEGRGDLQTAVAEAERAVAAAQAELFTCRAAVPTASPVAPAPVAMAGMDHSKMNMGTPAAAAKPASPGAKPVDKMAGMDHSKMNMGTPAAAAKPAARAAKPPDPMAGMDHSKMNTAKPAAAATSPAQGQKAAPMAGMDHSKMPMGGATAKPGDAPMAAGGEAKLPVMMAERIADPACAGNVGQASAPRAVFERKVYYFCSTAARDEFRKDPAAYLKKHPR